jgi:hypothetical protein
LVLSQQPRNVRRKLMRRYGTSLAGLALVVTLGGGTLYPTAHAQPQQARIAQGRHGGARPELIPSLHTVAVGALSRGAAATITVDGTTCTLADALVSANTNAVVGGCVAGTGDDVINMQADVTLSADLPPVSSNITIEGNDHIVDGDGQYTAFKVATASGDMTINNLIIQDTYSDKTFQAGGGGPALRVYDYGSLSLNESLITRSYGITASGGALLSITGTVSINDSTFSSNRTAYNPGGAIRLVFDTNAQIANSTFSDNTSGSGGGGAISAAYETNLDISSSTFSGNSANDGWAGGAIHIVDNSIVTIANSTFVNNVAYYGGALETYAAGTIIVRDSTVVGNSAPYGGGISNSAYDGSTTLINTIVSGNTGTYGNEIEQYAGMVIVDGNNVLGDDSSYSADALYGFTPGASDIVATIDGNQPTSLFDIIETDAEENPLLQDNGGPTKTIAILTGSPAIDIAPTGPDTDQRGFARPVTTNDSANPYDAGAFEFDALLPTKLYLPIIHTAPDDGASNVGHSFATRLFGMFASLLDR